MLDDVECIHLHQLKHMSFLYLKLNSPRTCHFIWYHLLFNSFFWTYQNIRSKENAGQIYVVIMEKRKPEFKVIHISYAFSFGCCYQCYLAAVMAKSHVSPFQTVVQVKNIPRRSMDFLTSTTLMRFEKETTWTLTKKYRIHPYTIVYI